MALTIEQFIDQLRPEFGFPSELVVDPESSLSGDLGLDSFGLLQLLVVIEELAGKMFDGPAIDRTIPWTIGDAHALYSVLAAT